MQLGTRWNVGDRVPVRLPESVVAAVAQVESELAGVATEGWRWTLTWLEGRPVLELDDGTVIRMSSAGAVEIVAPSV
ncbi:MAG: hypothetical protein ACKVOG_11940 [Rhodoglobus sp.]